MKFIPYIPLVFKVFVLSTTALVAVSAHATNSCSQDSLYYSSRLRNPPGYCPNGQCSLRKPPPGAIVSVELGSPYTPDVKRECVHEAMKDSGAISGTFRYCPNDNSPINEKVSRKPHCVTDKMLDHVHKWLNSAIHCLNPLNSSEASFRDLHVSSELIFGIMAHESRGHFNAASVHGKGLMQLTTAAVQEFYTPRRTLQNRIWNATKGHKRCTPFKAAMSRRIEVKAGRNGGTAGEKLVGNWACAMTAPEGTPRQLIVAISNLMACQKQAEDVLKSTSLLTRVDRYRTQSKDKKSSVKQEIIKDLILICHNWGSGNMLNAVRGMSRSKRGGRPKAWSDEVSFRQDLVKTGWSYSGQDGRANFPIRVREGLDKIRAAAQTRRCVK